MATVNAAAAASEPKYVSQKDVGKLGQDDFMKLLLTQLRNQDPMKPMDDAQFIAQLTQFSMLEKLQEMDQRLEMLVQTEQLGQANGLVGQSVEAISSESEEAVMGVVSSARMVDGRAVLVIGDKTVQLRDVQAVARSETSKMLEAAGLVGRQVQVRGSETDGSFEGRVTSAAAGPKGPVLVVDGKTVPLGDVARVLDGEVVALTDAATLVGMEVVAQSVASGYVRGVVDSIQVEDGESLLVIGGRYVKPREIISVAEGPDSEG